MKPEKPKAYYAKDSFKRRKEVRDKGEEIMATARFLRKSTEKGQSAGKQVKWDRNRHGHKTGLIFMRGVGGKLSGNPAMDAAYWIRNKLYGKPKPIVTIYDANGKAVATYDPNTKTRTPL